MATKFSQFVDGGDLLQTDIVVGLRAGNNTFFDIPFDPSDVASAATLATVVSDLNDVEAVTFLVQVADAAVPNAQEMGALATGIVKNTTTTGVQSIAINGTDYWAPGDQITLPGDPTAALEAATKQYVDATAAAFAAGFSYLFPVRVATTADLAATYDNGTAGVGATLTADANGAANIDGVALSVNDRVLFKDQTDTFENGVYELTTNGDGSNPSIFTRATDYDLVTEIQYGDMFNIVEGTVNARNNWTLDVVVATIGTDPLTFTQNYSQLVLDTTPELAGNLNVATFDITSADGTDLIDINDGSIDIQTDSTSRLDITDSGVRLGGANARVTTIIDDDTMATAAATNISTSEAIKAYVDSFPVNDNALINGGFDIWQRGTTIDSTTVPANNDDTYVIDMWNLLSNGNDIVDISRETTSRNDGQAYYARMTVATADTKFGVIQFLERINSNKIMDNSTSPVTFSVDLIVDNGLTLDDCRIAILNWTGTADSITSDVVATWEAGGTNPTLVNDWQYVNTPSNLSVTDSWARFTVTGNAGALGTTNNLAVMIWNNDTTVSAGATLSMGRAKLEVGSNATEFNFSTHTDEFINCQRYYEQTYEEGTEAGTVNAGNGLRTIHGAPSTNFSSGLQFETHKRAAPTVTLYSYQGNSGKINTWLVNAELAGTSTAAGISTTGFTNVSHPSASTTEGALFVGHYTASSEL